jgi:hypothetical protein
MNSRCHMQSPSDLTCEEKGTPLLQIRKISRLNLMVCDLLYLKGARAAATGARVCCGCSRPGCGPDLLFAAVRQDACNGAEADARPDAAGTAG